MTPGPEAAVAPGTTGAAVDPGHPSISVNDGRIRWSFPGPGNPLPRSMTAIENTASIRQVVSNKFTRDLHIDGMDIFDVRLAQVMTGGLNNWGLRSLANGRHTVWESFKSRQEAIAAGALMRSLRGDNSSQRTSADLNATLTHMTKNMFPGQDPRLWDNRYNAIKELTKELAKVVVQKGPAAANQSMLQQIQEL